MSYFKLNVSIPSQNGCELYVGFNISKHGPFYPIIVDVFRAWNTLLIELPIYILFVFSVNVTEKPQYSFILQKTFAFFLWFGFVGVSVHFEWFYNCFHLLFIPLLIMRIKSKLSKSLQNSNLYHQYTFLLLGIRWILFSDDHFHCYLFQHLLTSLVRLSFRDCHLWFCVYFHSIHTESEEKNNKKMYTLFFTVHSFRSCRCFLYCDFYFVIFISFLQPVGKLLIR